MYFAWPKLKCFCHHWLTLLLPQQKLALNPLSQRLRQRTFSSYCSFSSRRQGRKMHTLRSSRSTTYSYSSGVMCGYVHVSAYIHIVHVNNADYIHNNQSYWKCHLKFLIHTMYAIAFKAAWRTLEVWADTKTCRDISCLFKGCLVIFATMYDAHLALYNANRSASP